MAEFSLPLTAEGAVTAPDGAFALTVPAAESVTYQDYGEMNVVEIDQFGWVMADGVNKLRMAVEGVIYNASGLAPGQNPSAGVSNGARPAVVGTYTGQPGDGETITVGGIAITWKTTLVTDGTGPFWQVKIGADADTSYTNLKALFDRARSNPWGLFTLASGTQGTEFFDSRIYRHPSLGPYIYSEHFLECTAIDTGAGTITFSYVKYGTAGNSVVSTDTTTNFSFASAKMTGGSDGTGPGPEPGTYRYFYTWLNSVTGVETGRSSIFTFQQDGNTDIDVTVPAASADTDFDFINLYRTANDGVEFYLAATNPRADLTFTDQMVNEDLVSGIPWNDLNYRAHSEAYAPRGRALALWKGRLWSVGGHRAAEYSRGTVSVTKGSPTVTFSVQGVTALMESRAFQVDSTTEEYTALSVAEGGPTCVLDRNYEGATNAAASFKIKDTYDNSQINASIGFKYGQWPVTESPGRIDTDDPEGGTALLATKSRLFVFSKSSIVSVTGLGIESWEISPIGKNIGCVAPSMVVGVEGGGIFLSTDGFYAISPDESISSISSPKTPKGAPAQGIDATVDRIAWANVNQGYSEYDPVDGLVIFGVPLDGAVTPNYEIVFDMQNGAWSLNKRGAWTALRQAVTASGTQALLAGDRDGNIWHANLGASDGFYGAEAVATLSGAQTVRVLTASGTPFTTDEAGKPVVILYADGVTVAYGKVISSTTSALTLAEDLATAPAAGDQIILGGIAWQAKSGDATFGEEYRTKTLRSVTIRHAPSTRGDYFLSFAINGGSYALCPVGTSIGDLTEADGKVKHFTQWPGDTHSINLRGFKPGGRAVLRGGVFDLIIRENGQM